MPYVYISVVLIIIIIAIYFNHEIEKTEKETMARMAKQPVPNSRDMDVDFKWLNHLVTKECNNVKKLILYPRHRNKGGFFIITDDVYNEAIVITSKILLSRLSPEQYKILSWYIGTEEAIEGYIISVISEYLRDEVDKMNESVTKKY